MLNTDNKSTFYSTLLGRGDWKRVLQKSILCSPCAFIKCWQFWTTAKYVQHCHLSAGILRRRPISPLSMTSPLSLVTVSSIAGSYPSHFIQPFSSPLYFHNFAPRSAQIAVIYSCCSCSVEATSLDNMNPSSWTYYSLIYIVLSTFYVRHLVFNMVLRISYMCNVLNLDDLKLEDTGNSMLGDWMHFPIWRLRTYQVWMVRYRATWVSTTGYSLYSNSVVLRSWSMAQHCGCCIQQLCLVLCGHKAINKASKHLTVCKSRRATGYVSRTQL